MRPRVLILGATGMLGHTLMREFDAAKSFVVYGTARRIAPPANNFPEHLLARVFTDVDARNFEEIREIIKRLTPEIVVNCIGVIKQDPAVEDHANTIALNSLLPHLLAEECQRRNARLIHISTDCVFSGKSGNYRETDTPDPIDLYGRSKLLGEVAGPRALTLRTSMIGHELRGHRSLVDWFLAQTGAVNGYTRAIYSGVTTVELARVLISVILPRDTMSGLFHLAAEPISKYQLLSTIAQEYRWSGKVVPFGGFVCDRSLSAESFFVETGYRPPSWPEMVANMHRSATTHRSQSGRVC